MQLRDACAPFLTEELTYEPDRLSTMSMIEASDDFDGDFDFDFDMDDDDDE